MTKSVGQLVEEQIARWRFEQQRHLSMTESEQRRKLAPANAVTLSDEYGTSGSEVAAAVGESLQVPVYDRDIVIHIANNERVRVETVNLLDQRALRRIDDYVTALFHERNFDQTDYLHALTRTITALWGHGPGVFLGHGATHIIPRKHTLSVRMTAPKSVRVERIQEREQVDHRTAVRKVERMDAEREAFIRRLFHANIHSPHLYDLVLNAECADPGQCADLIATAFQRKFARHDG